MSRGDPEHLSNEAARLLGTAAVRKLKERMENAARARLRGASTNDVEECRGAVAQFQAICAMWDGLERMATEQEVREKRAVSEVV